MFRSVAPGFVLATPTLADPSFAKTVVLVFHHDPKGALGLVVNRPTDRRLREILDQADLSATDPRVPGLPICLGGPVSPESGWVVFEGGDPRQESFPVDEDLLVTRSLEVLKDLVSRPEAPRMLFCLGYAGWGPGQLDAELEEGAWIPASLERRTVFEVPFAERWRRSWLAMGIDPNLWAMQPGDG